MEKEVNNRDQINQVVENTLAYFTANNISIGVSLVVLVKLVAINMVLCVNNSNKTYHDMIFDVMDILQIQLKETIKEGGK